MKSCRTDSNVKSWTASPASSQEPSSSSMNPQQASVHQQSHRQAASAAGISTEISTSAEPSSSTITISMHQYISRATNNLPRQQPAETATCRDSNLRGFYGDTDTLPWPAPYYACVAQENRAYAWRSYAWCQGTRPPGKQGLLYVCGPMLGEFCPPENRAYAWRNLPPPPLENNADYAFCLIMRFAKELVLEVWHHFPSYPRLLHFELICTLFFLREWKRTAGILLLAPSHSSISF